VAAFEILQIALKIDQYTITFILMYLYSRFQAYFASSIPPLRGSHLSIAHLRRLQSGTNTICASGQQTRFIAGIEDLTYHAWRLTIDCGAVEVHLMGFVWAEVLMFLSVD
jgi:hypothetical protein